MGMSVQSMRFRSNVALRSGASLLVLALAGAEPALAQTTGALPTAPTSQSPLAGAPIREAELSGADPSMIVVTGRRAAIESAIRRKESAESIIDSVVADDAGKLPDNSITEVLQRVSGVAIVRFAALGDPDRFSAEGSGIQVRGLSGVASRLNGREIFGANNGRSLSFGDVTPELMSAVDIYKSPTADLIEGGTGGQIDLRTKRPFEFNERAFRGTLEGNYGDLAKKASFSGSFLATDRMDTAIGEIGVLVDFARSTFRSHSDFFRMEPYYKTRISGADYFIPGGYTYGSEDFRRDRTGIYVAVDWASDPDVKISATFFQSRYKEDRSGSGLFVTSKTLSVDPATSIFDENNGLIQSSNVFLRATGSFAPLVGTITSGGGTGVSRGNTVTRDYSGSFDWTPDGPLAVRGSVQHVQSTAVRDNYDVFREVAFPNSFALDLRGDLPLVTVPPASQAVFSNPAAYNWAATQPHNEINRGRQWAANIDAEYTFEDEGFFRSFKAGVRTANRTERDLNNGYNWTALGRGWNGNPQMTFANARPGDVETATFNNFFRGDTTLPGVTLVPSVDFVGRMDINADHAAPPPGFCGPPPPAAPPFACPASAGPTPTGYGGQDFKRVPFTPLDLSFNQTKTYAGYALARIGSRDGADGLAWNGNLGARVVRVENYSEGIFQQNSAQFIRNGVLTALATRGEPRSGARTTTKVLPALNFQLLPTPQVHIRAAYSITLDNPNFFALRASGNAGVRTLTPAGSPSGTIPTFDGFTTTTGKPDLKPTIANNFDLTLEWYPKRGSQFHVSAFYKTLDNLLVYTSTNREIPIYFTLPTPTVGTETAQVIDVANSDQKAKIKGFEVGARTFLDMLPGWLSGFGFEGNYTFIDSSNPGDRFIDINGVVNSNVPVTGLSKHNFNLTGLYEKKWLSLRVAYSWRSSYLQSTNSNGTNGDYLFFSAPNTSTFTDISLPVYAQDYGQLDAGIRLTLTKNLSVSVQASNILNATTRTLMGGYNGGQKYTRSWFVTDRRINAGVSFGF